MARAIMAYLRGSSLFLVPLARLEGGGHLEIEPVTAIDLMSGYSMQEIASGITSSLKESDRLVSRPNRHDICSPAQQAAGAKSWTQFAKGTTACDIEEKDGCFVITPLRPGTGGMFYDEPEKSIAVKLDPDQIDVLGNAVLKALNWDEEHSQAEGS